MVPVVSFHSAPFFLRSCIGKSSTVAEVKVAKVLNLLVQSTVMDDAHLYLHKQCLDI